MLYSCIEIIIISLLCIIFLEIYQEFGRFKFNIVIEIENVFFFENEYIRWQKFFFVIFLWWFIRFVDDEVWQEYLEKDDEEEEDVCGVNLLDVIEFFEEKGFGFVFL